MKQADRKKLFQAMQNPDGLAVEIDYEDKDGNLTRRVVSPTRWVGSNRDSFRALCLCRGEPRTFNLAKTKSVRLVKAADVLAPVEIIKLPKESGNDGQVERVD